MFFDFKKGFFSIERSSMCLTELLAITTLFSRRGFMGEILIWQQAAIL